MTSNVAELQRQLVLSAKGIDNLTDILTAIDAQIAALKQQVAELHHKLDLLRDCSKQDAEVMEEQRQQVQSLERERATPSEVFVVTRDDYEHSDMVAAFFDEKSAKVSADWRRIRERELAEHSKSPPYGISVHRVEIVRAEHPQPGQQP